MKDYIFSNFNFSKEYKNKLIETVKKMSNLEIGGDRLYDGVGNHYMQNPHEIVDLIFALKKHETDNKINLLDCPESPDISDLTTTSMMIILLIIQL